MEQELYELPEGWGWSTVDKISTKIQYGYTTKATEAGNAKFLRITDIQNGSIQWEKVPFVSITEKEIDKYRLQENDLVFARSGATAGKSILIEKPPINAIFASYLIRVVPSTKYVFPHFLALFFQSPEYWNQVAVNASGAAQPNINGSKLSKFTVPLPPHDEQKRIVAKLDALFTRINTAIAHLQETLKLAKDLFASALKSMVSDEQHDCSFRSLSSLGKFTGGGTPSKSKSEYWNGVTPWITPKDMKDLELKNSKLKITRLGVKESSAKLIPKNSVLIVARSGILRHTLPVCINRVEATVNQDIKVIIPGKDVSPEYVQYLLKGYENFILSQLVKGGVTVESLKYKEFQNYKFPIPDATEQHRIVDYLDTLSKHTRALEIATEDKIKNLTAIKASLLDHAFRGRL